MLLLVHKVLLVLPVLMVQKALRVLMANHPYVGTDGFWYFYQPEHENAIKEGDKAGWVQGPTSETSIYIVKSQEKPCWTLHVRNDKDEWQDVVLPTADNITSIKGVAIENGVISTDGTKEVSLYYGTANDKVKFGNPEIEYQKVIYLPVAMPKSMQW